MILEFNDTRVILREILEVCKQLKKDKSTEREQPNKNCRKIPVELVPYI